MMYRFSILTPHLLAERALDPFYTNKNDVSKKERAFCATTAPLSKRAHQSCVYEPMVSEAPKKTNK